MVFIDVVLQEVKQHVWKQFTLTVFIFLIFFVLSDNEAFKELFCALDTAEELLGKSRYFAGDQLTESDIRLFCTLIRFDSVYYVHFKCNLKQIENYPNLSNWLRDIYQTPGISSTVLMHQIKKVLQFILLFYEILLTYII